jgi:hypothetical protein
LIGPGIEGLRRLARLRTEAAKTIDRLLEFLDATESDCELEDAGELEPSLGSLERHCSAYSGDGRDRTGDQSLWSESALFDAEDEHDGAEPDVDDEPCLGSLDGMFHQGHAWAGPDPHHVLDGERDLAEGGIGDLDGLAEQVGSRLSPTMGVL